MRPALAILLLAIAWAAAPPAAAQSPAARADAALAAGDSSRAYRWVREGLNRAPDDLALLQLRLALELRGYGIGQLPRFLRQQQVTDVARRVRRLDPADTLALRVLTDDAVWTTLSTHDRVVPTRTQGLHAEFVSPAEVRARMGGSRFDVDARRRLAPDLDASGPARQARERAAEFLAAWREARPTDRRPYVFALALAVLDAEWEAALRAAEAFRAARPDSPEAALYVALARVRRGETAAADAAFEAAFATMEPGRAARYQDLGPLLTPEEAAAYAADSAAFAAAYWAAADPRLLTDVSERRLEHAARVAEADLLFGRDLSELFGALPWPPRGAETEQGRIWVRYGRPLRTTRFSPSEYGVGAYGDERFSVWDYDGFRFVFDDPDRDGSYRTYSPPASAFRDPRALADDYVLQDERMKREDPQRTQVAPTVAVPALVSRFRRPGGGTEAVVAFGVPTAVGEGEAGVFGLRGREVVAGARVPAAQHARGPVLRADTAAVRAAAATVPVGSADAVRAEVGAGAEWGGTTVPVAPLPASGFGLSDLLLATVADEDARGLVRRDGVGIVPLPWAAVRAGDPLSVYVEMYGLTLQGGRTRYAVAASLVPEARRGGLLGRIFGRGQGAGVAVETESAGDRSQESTVLAFDLAGQRPGRYTLRLEVTDRVTGAVAVAERVVTLE